MSESVAHCPFLNRSDCRCSQSFKLDHLGRALEFCFDRYKACPVYDELLMERQSKRGGIVQITLTPRHARAAGAAVPAASGV